MATEKLLAFDTETYYDNECSVSVLGNYAYTHHALFECYMISVVGDDGFEWCGHPKDCPWDRLRGYTWLSHNMGFDWAVFRRLVELGIAPADVEPKEWHCSANLCVYVGLSRALGLAVKAAFGVEVDKAIRNNEMKGMVWATAPDDLKQRVLAYALDDSRWCLKLWQEYSHEWPEHERWLSRHTYDIGAHGVCVDVPALDRDIAFLKTVVGENYNRIPWTAGVRVETGTDSEGEPVYATLPPMTPLSKKALKMKCDEVGIPMPSSLAQDSEECAAWEDQYGDRYDWIARMRTWRRTNALLKKFEAMRARVMPNDRMEFALLYFGASTGRWSGAGGVNMQNLARQAFVFDADFYMVDRDPKDAPPTDTLVDMRSKIIAPPGHVLIASDLSQIEPRCLAMMAGDRAFIQAVRSGQGPYEAHARSTMGWTGGPLKKEDPQLYLLSKARCIKEGTKVLTDNGFIEIEKITVDSRVWDGHAFVEHEGIIYKGEQPCVTLGADGFTQDHEVFVGEHETNPVSEGWEAAQLYRETRCAGWSEVWALVRLVHRTAQERGGWLHLIVGALRLRHN